jgi:hypothetical protein
VRFGLHDERHQPLVYLSCPPQVTLRGYIQVVSQVPSHNIVLQGQDAQDSIRRNSPIFSQPIDEPIECPNPRFSDVTRLRRPTSFHVEDLFSRESRRTPSSTGPALLVFLLDLSSTASTLVLRCKRLVANKSCARGTLQVRELCIKAVRKTIKG